MRKGLRRCRSSGTGEIRLAVIGEQRLESRAFLDGVPPHGDPLIAGARRAAARNVFQISPRASRTEAAVLRSAVLDRDPRSVPQSRSKSLDGFVIGSSFACF